MDNAHGQPAPGSAELARWWLSFADADLPAGQQFLGGVFVWAFDFADAVAVATAGGNNPGGEVIGWQVPPGDVDCAKMPDGVLFGRAELLAAGFIQPWLEGGGPPNT